MKKILVLSFAFLTFITNSSFARTRQLKRLNVEKKTLDLESKEVSGQYKGELKNVRRKDEFRLYDARWYGGLGLRYSMMDKSKMSKDSSRTDAQIQGETGQSSTVHYDENEIDLEGAGGFFGSLGMYWTNGLRMELEYSQTKYDSSSLEEFRFTETASSNNGKVWEYLHNNAINVNTIPITELEFDVKTIMFNVLYEPFKYDSKLTPYIGAGTGLVITDVESLPNDGSAKGLGFQGMVGLSYKMGYDGAMYLGYRYVRADDLEQTFKRVVQVSYSSPNYTAYTIQSKETYDYVSHNIEAGFRFFF